MSLKELPMLHCKLNLKLATYTMIVGYFSFRLVTEDDPLKSEKRPDWAKAGQFSQKCKTE